MSLMKVKIGLSDKKKLDTVINRAIESYYKSDEVKELLEL